MQGRIGFVARELRKLVLPLAVVASVWPATLIVEAATAGAVRSPRGAGAIAVMHGSGGLAALEASQSALASEAEFGIGDTPIPDLADRAARLGDSARAWYRSNPGGGARDAAITTAMRELDAAISALALNPSPGARLALEQAQAQYEDSIRQLVLI